MAIIIVCVSIDHRHNCAWLGRLVPMIKGLWLKSSDFIIWSNTMSHYSHCIVTLHRKLDVLLQWWTTPLAMIVNNVSWSVGCHVSNLTDHDYKTKAQMIQCNQSLF